MLKKKWVDLNSGKKVVVGVLAASPSLGLPLLPEKLQAEWEGGQIAERMARRVGLTYRAHLNNIVQWNRQPKLYVYVSYRCIFSKRLFF